MKTPTMLLALAFTATLSATAQDQSCGGNLRALNSEGNDYRPFIIYGDQRDVLYFTSSRDSLDKGRGLKKAREAKMYVSERPAQSRMRASTAAINDGWSEPRRVVLDDKLMDAYTQGALAYSAPTNTVVFAAERAIGSATSSSYNLDLWQATVQSPDKFGDIDADKASPLAAVNREDSWESQPAFDPSGSILFFVSNRDVSDSNDLNIYYSVRSATGAWLPPVLVRDITTQGREMSPFVSADGGFLYFASDWNYDVARPGNSGRDIWRIAIRVEAGENGSDTVRCIGAPENMDAVVTSKGIVAGDQACLSKVNSDADDEFPFLSPDGKYLLFTSNRDGGAGLRDNYAFGLPRPRICIKAEVEERTFDQYGLLVRRGFVNRPVVLEDVQERRTESFQSEQGVVCVDPNSVYNIRYDALPAGCGGTVEVDRSERQVRTGNGDTTIIVRYVVNVGCPPAPPAVDLSDASAGVPYYITGYWMPNTRANLEKFSRDWNAEGSTLKWVNPSEPNVSRRQNTFIDPYDLTAGDTFQPEQSRQKMEENSADFGLYATTASKVEDFLQQKVYGAIEKAIAAMTDTCCTTRALKITIHGYTDACGLRPGSYVGDDVIIGTAVPPIFGIDADDVPGAQRLVIPSGHPMTKSTLQTTSGKSVRLAGDGQNGNVVLSMLRAAGMAQTIREGMSARNEQFRSMITDGRVVFETMGFGVYGASEAAAARSRKGSAEPCPPAAVLSLDVDGANGPRKNESCNVPEHRRIMVYFSYIDSLQVAAGHTLDACGRPDVGYLKRLERVQNNHDSVIAARKRQQDEGASSTVATTLKPDDKDMLPPIVPGSNNAFVVEYATATSEDDASAARALLAVLGVDVNEVVQQDQDRSTWRFLSKEFDDKDKAMASFSAVSTRFSALRKVLSTSKVKRVK